MISTELRIKNYRQCLKIVDKYYLVLSGSTTIRTNGISYTRQLVRKPKPDISYKNETRHFVRNRNQTFRTKMKPDIWCNLYYTTYHYNVVSYVHIPLVPQMQEQNEAERRANWPCLNVATWRRERSDRAIQHICQPLQLNQVPYILAATALKASNSVVRDLFCKLF